MNHDPDPSSAARQRPALASASPDRAVGDRAGESSRHERPSPSRTGSNDPSAAERKEKRRAGLSKKLQFVSRLQRDLDMAAVAYICTLYYMECSLFLFGLRLLPHFLLLSPKDGLILLPAHRPHVFAIFVPNIICFLSHAVASLPVAGEASRGYLHGGVIIDFIGQKPPTWRSAFLLIDAVVFGIQCLMLAVHTEREKLRKAVKPSLRVMVPGSDGQMLGGSTEEPEADASRQDHDSEERGVLREEALSAVAYAEGDGGIELEPLTGGRSGGGADQVGQREGSSGAVIDQVDVLRSGNAVLSNFHVVHAIRTVGSDYRAAAAYSVQSIGYAAQLAAMAAERRARLNGGQQRAATQQQQQS